ncbi:MAG TPA: hypothetical protein VMR75_00845 [Candidatus Saccharimonadales bacterium]|nr:hypothetical protein [Candidatus Saccharimonadales bacterium]
MDEEVYAFEAQQAASDQSGLSIHAGFPNPSDDARSLSLDFNQLLVTHSSGTFVFRIRGQEWQSFSIWDGDIAVVDRVLDPLGSDLVIWSQESEVGFGLSRLRLIPEGATLWGVVTAIIHELRKVSHE